MLDVLHQWSKIQFSLLLLLLLPLVTVAQSTPLARTPLNVECIVHSEEVDLSLPNNLRIIEVPTHEGIGYTLINPQNNKKSNIPGTEFPGAILLSKDGRILLLREIALNQIEWV